MSTNPEVLLRSSPDVGRFLRPSFDWFRPTHAFGSGGRPWPPAVRTCAGALTVALTFAAAALPSPAVATSELYYGGPVISNSELVMVNWSSTVPATVKNGMPQFYTDVVQSDYWTTLLEYSTVGVTAQDNQPGSEQSIGMGTYAGAYTITPVKCATSLSCTLSDVDISTELTAQLDAQNLPVPTFDSSGNPNTVYMLHFAPNVTIALGGGTSCVNFCATSINFGYGAATMSALLIPDQGTGGCALGCSSGISVLDRETYVASYQLGALTTCPLAASAVSVARPLAWYDATGGRISEKCSNQTATIGVNGHSYSVEKWWSNQSGSCVSNGGKFVVVPSADANGTIDPSLPQAVEPNATAMFTVTPDDGFTASIGGTCGGSLGDSTLTTDAVTADCTVVVSFSDRIFAANFQ